MQMAEAVKQKCFT